MAHLNVDTLKILLVVSTLPNYPYTGISMALYCCYLQVKDLNSHLPLSNKPAALLRVLIWFIVSLRTELLSFEIMVILDELPLHHIQSAVTSYQFYLNTFLMFIFFHLCFRPVDYTSKC